MHYTRFYKKRIKYPITKGHKNKVRAHIHGSPQRKNFSDTMPNELDLGNWSWAHQFKWTLSSPRGHLTKGCLKQGHYQTDQTVFRRILLTDQIDF